MEHHRKHENCQQDRQKSACMDKDIYKVFKEGVHCPGGFEHWAASRIVIKSIIVL